MNNFPFCNSMSISIIKFFLFALLMTQFSFQHDHLDARQLDETVSEGVDTPFGIMSYNLRYDNTGDGDNRWDERRDLVVNLIRFHEPDFIGIQEGLLHQLEYLDQQLPHMSRIGVGRNDGEYDGEFSAIYYNQSRFELVADTDSTVWLSEFPGLPSKSWDAALPRILTFGRFSDRITGQDIYVFNTHFDHAGEQARWESAHIVLRTMISIAGDLPVVLTGDFNAEPGSNVYEVLTADSSTLKDAIDITEIPHVGPLFTSGGFEVNDNESGRRIDYIFVNDQIDVIKHSIIATFRNGVYPSDHLPVYTSVTFQE